MNKKCQRALACDVRKGPIGFAEKNIAEYGLSQYISTRIGYGLEPLEDNEVDVVVIAGMGGLLIKEILEKGFGKAKRANALIIQPMNAIELVRRWLCENGFDIFDERLAKRKKTEYILHGCKVDGRSKIKDEVYYYIGEKLFENKDPLLPELIKRRLDRWIKLFWKWKNER